MMKRSLILLCTMASAAIGCTTLRADRVVSVVGGGEKEPAGVQALEVRLREPFGVAFDPDGTMFVIEMSQGNRLLKKDLRGDITRVAGVGQGGFSGDGGPLLGAQFNGPHNLAITPDGVLLIADTWNGRVRRLDRKSDIVTTLPGFQVPASAGRDAGPYCVTLDFTGARLLVADLRRVHAVDLNTGKSSVVAGNGEKGIPRDGSVATDAPLVDPRAVAADRKGNVYILERGGHSLRVVDVQGRIRTVVNAKGLKGATGDGGPAIEATMNGPKHLCVDLDDNVIIADAENHLVRKYVPKDSRIVRVAGTGKEGGGGLGGPPDKAQLARPHGVTVGPDGLLYITDSYNNRILRIER